MRQYVTELLCVVTVVLSLAGGAVADGVAIGNNDYGACPYFLNLDTCISDAMHIAAVLRVDTAVRPNQTKAEMRAAAQALPCGEGDLKVFFYAGHGDYTVAGEDTSCFMVSKNCLLYGSAELESDLAYGGPCPTVVILDCCHSGGMIPDATNITYLTAVRADESALDKSGHRGPGVFTDAIVAGVTGNPAPADYDTSGDVTLGELHTYLSTPGNYDSDADSLHHQYNGHEIGTDDLVIFKRAGAKFNGCQAGTHDGNITAITLDISGGDPGQTLFVSWHLAGQEQGLLEITLDAQGDFQSPPVLQGVPPAPTDGQEDELKLMDPVTGEYIDTQRGCWVNAPPEGRQEGDRTCACYSPVENSSWGSVKALYR
jgi:hypothetical protein